MKFAFAFIASVSFLVAACSGLWIIASITIAAFLASIDCMMTDAADRINRK